MVLSISRIQGNLFSSLQKFLGAPVLKKARCQAPQYERGNMVNKAERINSVAKGLNDTGRGTKIALWWLRHYESMGHFWKGFSCVWVIGMLLSAIVGYPNSGHASIIMLFIGVIVNTAMYLCISAINGQLRDLEDGPEKEEAHELMIKIIRRRVLDRA